MELKCQIEGGKRKGRDKRYLDLNQVIIFTLNEGTKSYNKGNRRVRITGNIIMELERRLKCNEMNISKGETRCFEKKRKTEKDKNDSENK